MHTCTYVCKCGCGVRVYVRLELLVHPTDVGGLPLGDLLGTEPKSNLLLCTLDAVAAVDHVAVEPVRNGHAHAHLT